MTTNGIGSGFNDRQNEKTLPIYLSVCKTVPHSKQELNCHLLPLMSPHFHPEDF